MSGICRFILDEGGATAIEYGLIVGLIFLAILSTFGIVQQRLDAVFTTVGNSVGSAGN
jgi:pilus assembly protein Flp/PilA